MSNMETQNNLPPSDDLQGKYLSFYVAENLYGIALLDVIEIINIQPITTVPHLPYFVKGIINLRGKIIPVIDMRLKFGKEKIDYDDKTCIIVISIETIQIGFIVDRVSEVVTSDPNQMSNVPSTAEINHQNYIREILKTEQEIVLVLDCEQIIDAENIYLSI